MSKRVVPMGPYSKAVILARPDGRSREARMLNRCRNVYAEYLGGWDKLSPPQQALIERIAMLQLRVAKLDEKMLTGQFTDFDTKQYLAWSNSLVRAMREVGLTSPEESENDDPLERLNRHLAKQDNAA
jgi:hypothetical protein